MRSLRKSAFARKSRKERMFYAAVACVFVAGVAFVSFLPGDDKQVLHTRGRFHSWGHLVAFILVSFVAGKIARSERARVLFFVGALVFGFGIEYAEHAVFHGSLEWKDVFVDSIGVTCGTLLAMVTTPRGAV